MGEMIGDSILIYGHLTVKITDVLTGKVQEYHYANKILNTYLAKVAQWGAGVNNTGQNPAHPATKFMLGRGSGTPAVTDTSLFAESSSSLITVSSRYASGSVSTFVINYPPDTLSGTYTEGGLLDVNGTLLTHVMLTPNLDIIANQSVLLTYTITIKAQ